MKLFRRRELSTGLPPTEDRSIREESSSRWTVPPGFVAGRQLTGADLNPAPESVRDPIGWTSSDEWMPDTETHLIREEPMPAEMDLDENARYADPEPTLDAEERSDQPNGEPGSRRPRCPHCRGTGKVLTVNDMLRESIVAIGNRGDEVVRQFYTRLLNLAPDLRPLFPQSVAAATLEGPVPAQRERLLAALVAVAQTYEPARADRLSVLDTQLEAFGRAHAAFSRPDGTVRGATLDEYHLVKMCLFGALHEVVGDDWLPEFDEAWSEAYDYAAAAMLYHGQRSGFTAARYPRA